MSISEMSVCRSMSHRIGLLSQVYNCQIAYAMEIAIERLTANDNWAKGFSNQDAVQTFSSMIKWWREQYVTNHLADTFLFSTSEVDSTEVDGSLSMWRSYGGDGSGAAIIFDLSALTVREDSPFLIERVAYSTAEECRQEADRIIELLLPIVPHFEGDENRMFNVARLLFDRFKILGLLTKHKAFSDENEWRLVYLPERDTAGVLTHMIDYHVSDIVHPKMKYKIEDGSKALGGAAQFDQLVYRIILGPTGASNLSKIGFWKVVQKHLPTLKGGVHGSSIPYRQKIV